uniref:Mucin-1 n=1 Tax=Laticauda laticaudata TaxID=8630 RepID=A0A8C5WYH3_LATLA
MGENETTPPSEHNSTTSSPPTTATPKPPPTMRGNETTPSSGHNSTTSSPPATTTKTPPYSTMGVTPSTSLASTIKTIVTTTFYINFHITNREFNSSLEDSKSSYYMELKRTIMMMLIYYCRRNHRGSMELLNSRDSYHPMNEYPTYQTHSRFAAPINKQNPYDKVRAARNPRPEAISGN